MIAVQLTMPVQYTLPVQFQRQSDLASLWVGPSHAPVFHGVQHLLNNHVSPLIMWGPASSGKSHVLHATCQQASEQGLRVGYLPWKEIISGGPTVLEDLDILDLLIWDDFDTFFNSTSLQAQWEEALFHTFNRLHEKGGVLVIASRTPPREWTIGLQDLYSRLLSGPVYHLRALTDDEKIKVLMHRANQRGLLLSESVGSFLLRRLSRDLHVLCQALQELDRCSLQQQRRITIPFVKEVLEAF
ncbi:MAG: DnaA regulatory inactivator Hda [Pseudomonadota bacterium]